MSVLQIYEKEGYQVVKASVLDRNLVEKRCKVKILEYTFRVSNT